MGVEGAGDRDVSGNAALTITYGLLYHSGAIPSISTSLVLYLLISKQRNFSCKCYNINFNVLKNDACLSLRQFRK